MGHEGRARQLRIRERVGKRRPGHRGLETAGAGTQLRRVLLESAELRMHRQSRFIRARRSDRESENRKHGSKTQDPFQSHTSTPTYCLGGQALAFTVLLNWLDVKKRIARRAIRDA